MKSVRHNLRLAIYTRLTSGATAISFDVTSAPSVNHPLPFVHIGDIDCVPDNSKGVRCWDCIVTFHLWSEWGSDEQIDAMENAVLGSLTTAHDSSPSELTVTNYTVIRHDIEDAIQMQDLDDKTLHGIFKYKFLLQES